MKHQGFIPYPSRKASKSILQFWRIKGEITHNAKGIIGNLNSILTMTLKKLIRHKLSLLALLASSYFVHADTDVNADITTDTTWSKANSPYVLKDFVFVRNDATLTIEAGVTIYGEEGKTIQGQGVAPTLIITNGSKINAVGTADEPIVFTSILAKTQTLSQNDKGLWGGLILLGNAPINGEAIDGNAETTSQIEGLPSAYISAGKGSILDSYKTYGGNEKDDNSGTLKYVSIRHGGSLLGVGNEINGLTCGGVGNGTTLEYIEVYANADDGIEMFGGSVNGKYLSIAYCNDDGLDFDHGYNGLLQYVSIIQHGNGNSNCAIEWDGAAKDDKGNTSTGAPEYSQPTIMNLTAIGSGSSSDSTKSKGMDIRDNGGGYVLNSIFTEFPNGILKIEDTKSSKGSNDGSANPTSSGSQYLLEQNILGFFGNIFYQGDEATANTEDAVVADSEGNGADTASGYPGNTAADVKAIVFASNTGNDADVSPALLNANLENGPIMPFPSSSSPALTGAVDISSYQQDGFFDVVAYQGAFASDAPADNWLAGWTAVSNPFNVSISGETIATTSSAAPASISSRGGITETDFLNASVKIKGEGTRKIMFRVKGPSMNFAGTKLAYPKLEIYHKENNWGEVIVSSSFQDKTANSGYTDVTSSYTERHTGNSVEPMVVLELEAGTFSCIVSSDNVGAEGSAIVEIYDVTDD